AKDENLSVDLQKFEALEEEAKEKSRKAHKGGAQTFASNFFTDFTKVHKNCQFEGYQTTACDARLIGIVIDGTFTDELMEGQEGMLLLDQTPFYAEMGGQVGDIGSIGKGAALFQVDDTIAPYAGVIGHLGKMKSGHLRKNDSIHASIDTLRRSDIQNHHT